MKTSHRCSYPSFHVMPKSLKTFKATYQQDNDGDLRWKDPGSLNHHLKSLFHIRSTSLNSTSNEKNELLSGLIQNIFLGVFVVAVRMTLTNTHATEYQNSVT